MEMPIGCGSVPAPTTTTTSTKGKMMELPPEMTKKEDVTVEVATKKVSTMKVKNLLQQAEEDGEEEREEEVEPKKQKTSESCSTETKTRGRFGQSRSSQCCLYRSCRCWKVHYFRSNYGSDG